MGAATALFASNTFAADANFAAKPPPAASLYDWDGWYIGANLGYAAGRSNFTGSSAAGGAPPISGSLNLYQPPDLFAEGGSYFQGFQVGYNRMLSNRVVIGAEADMSFPNFPDINGNTIGGGANFPSPTPGPANFAENVVASGTWRGRVGYSPGNILLYATGGLSWTFNQQTLTLADGTTYLPYLWHLGWMAGVGIEMPILPQWTAKAEYLFTDYGSTSVFYSGLNQHITSDFSLQQFRLGLNYQFNHDSPVVISKPVVDDDLVNFHGQATFTADGYPSIRSPYQGQNSLPGSGQVDETFDATLAAGFRLWKGAEFWTNPEIDEGFGFGNTHGVAGFPSAESYKLGATYPYARIQRAFIRQIVVLGGDTEKVDADFNQFAGTRTADRLVLTVGRFAIVDIFDTNKYANNPKSDFLNWSMINAGTFDYAGDGWGYTYGAAAEWYTGRWTLRGGVFDLSKGPAGGNTPTAYGLDPTFSNFESVGEIEERHELWGQPGKIKITGYLERGSMGSYSDAIALALATGQPADINAVRTYAGRPGISVNLEQQINDTVGLFARAGWADGSHEPWDFTDIDQYGQIGVSINGKLWGRPDDTVGIAGLINGISANHAEFLNLGGMGILVGDGQLPNPTTEKIIEAYYSYAVTASTKLTLDYQFIADPAYNSERGFVNVFTARVHSQF